MLRALALAALVCVCCSLLSGAEARWTIRPRPTRTTTMATTTTTTRKPTTMKPRPRPTTTTTPAPIPVDDEEDYDDKTWHPIEVGKPRLIEQFDSRSLDGHYEYRYVLSNGDTRYERAYWLPVGHTKVLAKKGYYSYPLPNHEFMTVFYTADHQGYHQDSSTFSKQQPALPRSLDAPEYEPPKVNEQQQHHKHPRKPNKGHGRKPTQPTTKTVSHSDSMEKEEILQDVVAVKATDVVPATTMAAIPTEKLQQKLRKQHANDETEFVPVTTVEVEEQQKLQQQQQQLQETVGEISQEADAATTLAVEHQQDVTVAAAANWEPEDDVAMQ